MDNIKIGNFLQHLRKKKGITQQELADVYNISNKTVSKWERGESIPEINTLLLIAKFYDVTVDEILNGKYANKDSNNISISTTKSNEKNLLIFLLISVGLVLIGIMMPFLFEYKYKTTGFFIGLIIMIIGSITMIIGAIIQKPSNRLNFLRFKYLYIFFAILLISIFFILF